MESFGELLKNARESKNLELDKVSREISIELKYLQGLEDEDNSVFPGEAYMTGFLRNYSDYLDLDPEYILKLYRNKKIQESPVPEGLIVKHRPKWIYPTIIIPSVLIIGVIVTILVMLLNQKKAEADDPNLLETNSKNQIYELTDTKFNQRVYKGDQFLVTSVNESQIIVTVSGTLGSFELETPVGKIATDLAEEAQIDIDGDTLTDLIVYVSDISRTDEAHGAEVSIILTRGTSVAEVAYDAGDIPLASEIKSSHPQKVIFEDNRAYPFTLTATFRDPCIFRSKVDSMESSEAYYTRGEVVSVNPKNGVRLWFTNGNAVSFSILADSKTYSIEIGAAGRLIAEDVKWIKEADGKYKLVVIELD